MTNPTKIAGHTVYSDVAPNSAKHRHCYEATIAPAGAGEYYAVLACGAGSLRMWACDLNGANVDDRVIVRDGLCPDVVAVLPPAGC